MPYSFVKYTGNGAATFSVPFTYISQSHVQVTVNGSPAVFTFTNPYLINITVPPAVGSVVEIRRITPRDAPIVNFTDGSVLLEQDLDLLAVTNLYLAQEALDTAVDSLLKDYTGVYQAGGARITGVASPVASSDVATKGWVETSTSTELAQAKALSQAATVEYTAFATRYMGTRAVAPSGAMSSIGALYFDNPTKQMMVYTGYAWEPLQATASGSSYIGSLDFISTAGQTAFTAGGLLEGYTGVQVYINGLRQATYGAYSVYDGVVTLSEAATAGDIVTITAFGNQAPSP